MQSLAINIPKKRRLFINISSVFKQGSHMHRKSEVLIQGVHNMVACIHFQIKEFQLNCCFVFVISFLLAHIAFTNSNPDQTVWQYQQ